MYNSKKIVQFGDWLTQASIQALLITDYVTQDVNRLSLLEKVIDLENQKSGNSVPC